MFGMTSKVRYSELSDHGKMSLSSLLMRLEDVCVFHLDSLGVGPEEWVKEQKSWVIISWQVRIKKMPVFGQTVTAGTWAYRFHNFEGDRNFTLTAEDGTILAEANSRWIYYDLAKQRPARVPQMMIDGFGLEEQIPNLDAPRRIELPNTPCTEKKHFHVVEEHLDVNRHVNNLRYIDMAKRYLPQDAEVKELRVEYVRQCVLDDEICPMVWETEKEVIVSLANREGSPCAIVCFML